MLMKAHYPAANITIAKVHLERPLSIEVALAHAWILPLIDLPLLRMRFFSSYCTCIRCLLSSDLVFSYKFQRFHSKMKGKLKLQVWFFGWPWFLLPLMSETPVLLSADTTSKASERSKRSFGIKFRRKFPSEWLNVNGFCGLDVEVNGLRPNLFPTTSKPSPNDRLYVASSHSWNNRMTINRWKLV